MKRTKTGIPGFDELVQGGIPFNSTVLVCGTPATAKSIFCMQFTYNGASMFKEKSLYVSFEQSQKDLEMQAKQFSWKFAQLKKSGMLHFICIPVKDINQNTFKEIVKYVKDNKIKRLVIDSLSTMSINAPLYAAIDDLFLKDLVTQENIFSPSIAGDFILKRFVYNIMGELQELPVTTLLISEIGKDSQYMSRDTISEFLADGIIQMIFEPMGGQYSRSLLVRKMRHVKNDEDIHSLEIGKKGTIVHKVE